jgi:hypothetical protein
MDPPRSPIRPAPVLLAQLRHRLQDAERGVRHQDVELAELLLDGLEDAVDVRRVGDVGANLQRLRTDRGDLGVGLFGCVAVAQVVEADPGAVLRQSLADGASDAARSARDQRELAFKIDR